MKTIFSFEEIDLSEETVSQQHDAQFSRKALDECLEGGIEDDSGLINVVGGQLDAARHIDEIRDMVINAEKTRGLSNNVAQAAQIAVENMCAAAGVVYKPVTFRPQASIATRLENSNVAIEGFAGAIKSVWQKIVEMIRKFIAWVRRKVSRRQIVDKAIKRKADHLGDKLAKEKTSEQKEPAAVKPVIEPKSYINPSIAKRLSIKGSVPQNVELVRAALDHYALMRRFYTAGLQYCMEIALELVDCEKLLKKDGNAFNEAVSNVLGKLMSRSLITTPCKHPPRSFSKGVLLYEEPLIFGDRSYFKTSANSVADITLEDVMAEVGDSTLPSRPDPEQKLYPLSDAHRDAVWKSVTAHAKIMSSFDDRFGVVVDRIDQLTTKLSHLDQTPDADPKDIDRNGRRARLLMRAFNIFAKQFNSISGGLYEYDQQVNNALLDYALLTNE